MNKEFVEKILDSMNEDITNIKLMYSEKEKWTLDNFIINSEFVIDLCHDIFDKIVLLQSKYTATDNKFLNITLHMEEHLEDGNLFKLEENILEMKDYLEL